MSRQRPAWVGSSVEITRLQPPEATVQFSVFQSAAVLGAKLAPNWKPDQIGDM